MDDKLSNTVNNMLTVLGGALILYPIIDQAAKKLAPELEKLTSGELIKEMELLPETISENFDKIEQTKNEKPEDIHENKFREKEC